MTDLKIDPERAKTMSLEDWGQISSAIDGPIETRGCEVWLSPDERVGTGVWECGAGRFQARFEGRGEFIQIVSGRMTCSEIDGPTIELGPGDAMTFPPGWTGEWYVHEPVRKLYCEFKP